MYHVKYWSDENQTGHKVICLLGVYNVLGQWKYVAFPTPQHSITDWRIFGIFKNNQNFHTKGYFQKSFRAADINLGVLVTIQKLLFPQNSEILRVFLAQRGYTQKVLYLSP